MTENVQVKVDRTPKGYEITVSGAEFDAERAQHFLNSRLSCARANKCRAKNETVDNKIKCATNLAFQRLENRQIEAGPALAKVSKAAHGLHIELTGNPGELENFANQEKVMAFAKAILACRAKNHCSPAQKLAGRWNCVSTLGERIFQA